MEEEIAVLRTEIGTAASQSHRATLQPEQQEEDREKGKPSTWKASELMATGESWADWRRDWAEYSESSSKSKGCTDSRRFVLRILVWKIGERKTQPASMESRRSPRLLSLQNLFVGSSQDGKLPLFLENTGFLGVSCLQGAVT